MGYLAAFMGLLSFGASAYAAAGKKAAGYLQAQEYFDSAKDVVKAHAYNVNERTKVLNFNKKQKRKATRRNIASVREKGQYDQAMVAQQGAKLYGQQRATMGGSGAQMDTGTTLSVGMQQISNNMFSERMVIADTKKNIDFLASEFVDWNTAQDFEFQSWKRKATFDRNQQFNKLVRMGKMTKRQADMGYVGNMVQGAAGGLNTYNQWA